MWVYIFIIDYTFVVLKNYSVITLVMFVLLRTRWVFLYHDGTANAKIGNRTVASFLLLKGMKSRIKSSF